MPVPLPPLVIVIQDGALLVAVRLQVELEGVTVKLPAPPAAVGFALDADKTYVQAVCVIVNDPPEIVITPVRTTGPVLPATV